jgi:alkylation response protein AidB-like acyl-CoA dehydrogenase
MKRNIFEAEHEQLRETTREFIERELMPNAEKWEQDRIVDRSAFAAAGKYGLIGFNMPEAYGGGGSDDFRFNAVIDEELARYGGPAPSLSQRRDGDRDRDDRARCGQ